MHWSWRLSKLMLLELQVIVVVLLLTASQHLLLDFRLTLSSLSLSHLSDIVNRHLPSRPCCCQDRLSKLVFVSLSTLAPQLPPLQAASFLACSCGSVGGLSDGAPPFVCPCTERQMSSNVNITFVAGPRCGILSYKFCSCFANCFISSTASPSFSLLSEPTLIGGRYKEKVRQGRKDKRLMLPLCRCPVEALTLLALAYVLGCDRLMNFAAVDLLCSVSSRDFPPLRNTRYTWAE